MAALSIYCGLKIVSTRIAKANLRHEAAISCSILGSILVGLANWLETHRCSLGRWCFSGGVVGILHFAVVGGWARVWLGYPGYMETEMDEPTFAIAILKKWIQTLCY